MQSSSNDEDDVNCKMPTTIKFDDWKTSFERFEYAINGLVNKKRNTSKEENAYLERLLQKSKEDNANFRREKALLRARDLMTQSQDDILANQKRTEEMFVQVYDTLHEKLQKAETELSELKIRCIRPYEEQHLRKELENKEEQVRLLKEQKDIMKKTISVL
ncbi:uncharacterized protein LOC127843151 [Dreissena polymorpha]|uniref:uncharacterized protein LOC127843151 n=1 Tax=Dreissena polymorpha TaxID=45954 RepID=UPI002263DC31|nr:uncharacterized protein LOC127843151 [Dreissena polymorpha]